MSATSDGTYVKAPDVATKPENGGTFFFKVKITNTSAADTITVTDLADLVSDEEITSTVSSAARRNRATGFRSPSHPVRRSRARSRMT